MITLPLTQFDQYENEIVVFGDIIVIDATITFTYEELDTDFPNCYPDLDIAKIKEIFELNKRKFPDESKELFKLTKFSLSQLVAIASGTKNKDMMVKLAKHKKSFVRRALAQRSDLSEDLQLILVRDKQQKVLNALALNEALTTNAFNILIKNADTNTKRILTLNSSASDKMLEILAKDEDQEIRYFVYQRHYQQKGLSQYLKEYLEEEFGIKDVT